MKDDPRSAGTEKPQLDPPWANIRTDAEKAVAEVIVSHRVRKKVSGPLHKETVYGDTGEEVTNSNGTYRMFVTKKKVESLSRGEIEDIRDGGAREIIKNWIDEHGGDPKKSFESFPLRGEKGPEIRKVRLMLPQKMRAMVEFTTGYAATGNNHHIAIYRTATGNIDADVVSLHEAMKRLVQKLPIVKREKGDGQLILSLSLGDTFYVPDGDRKGYWNVKSISSNGQIFSKPINSADMSATGQWGPSPAPLIKANVQKVSIDPIGRIRKAND
jgi:CRISPR-associated endonuclease Csn1